MYKKIYIIGPVASGKSTLAKKLSEKYQIKYYELDKIIWNDEIGIKRNNKEINLLLKKILKQNSYIIEDVGRDIFSKARKEVDVIYYLKLNHVYLYFRVIKRWIKQKMGIEESNYKQTLNTLFDYFSWLHEDLVRQKNMIKELNASNNNLIILKSRDIKKMI